MLRRHFLATPLAAAAESAVSRELFVKAPGKGTAVMAYAWYTERRGGAMLSIEQRWSRSDTIDIAYYRRSRDYGRTWSDPEPRRTLEKRPSGTFRRYCRPGWVDPSNGRYIELSIEGTLPTDDPLEGMRQWYLVSSIDHGPVEPLIARGAEFSAAHPLPGVWVGKNSVMLGDNTCQPIAGPRRDILVPVEITPLGADGKIANPGGGYTYHDSGILHGHWNGRRVEWEMGDLIKGDPTRTTRGAIEPTLAKLDGGRVLCVMRGSNDRKLDLPSWRWISTSADGGWKWSTPEPWTYDDGAPFFSPSACSQLIEHSDGRVYWIGNITKDNPRGNRPRYPLIIGEVDRRTARLIRATVRPIDDRAEGEDPILTLSNFYAREERRSRAIAVHCTRLFAFNDGWVGDAFLYRVKC